MLNRPEKKPVEEIVEFLGIDVDQTKLKNPHLRRAIQHVADAGYRFRYGDHSRRKYGDYGDSYGDWREKYHETVYSEYDKYADWSRDYSDG